MEIQSNTGAAPVLSPAQMDEAMDRHFAHELADDVEGVLGTLTEDVRHDVIGWPPGPSRGRETVRGFYEQLFQDLSDGKVRTLARRYGSDFLVDESLWEGRATGKPFGIDGRGRAVSFRLLHVVGFAPDGAIASEQVWIDFPSLQQQLLAG